MVLSLLGIVNVFSAYIKFVIGYFQSSELYATSEQVK